MRWIRPSIKSGLFNFLFYQRTIKKCIVHSFKNIFYPLCTKEFERIGNATVYVLKCVQDIIAYQLDANSEGTILYNVVEHVADSIMRRGGGSFSMMTTKLLRWLESLIKQDKLIPFYKCKEWRTLRQEALERDHYECQICKEKGKYTSAQNVHHLKEVKDRPDLALTLDNLECVCIPCHNAIHDKRLRNDKRKPFVNEERW